MAMGCSVVHKILMNDGLKFCALRYTGTGTYKKGADGGCTLRRQPWRSWAVILASMTTIVITIRPLQLVLPSYMHDAGGRVIKTIGLRYLRHLIRNIMPFVAAVAFVMYQKVHLLLNDTIDSISFRRYILSMMTRGSSRGGWWKVWGAICLKIKKIKGYLYIQHGIYKSSAGFINSARYIYIYIYPAQDCPPKKSAVTREPVVEIKF